MQIKACNNTGAASFNDESYSSVEAAVAALATNHNLQRLLHIARQRLNRLAARSPGQRLRGLRDPGEFVNQAIELILTGQRKAQARNLSSFDAFRNYVQGVMQSLINHELERVIRQGEQVSIDSLSELTCAEEPQAAHDVVREISIMEAKKELFPRLREYAKGEPAILQVIDKWEESWPFSDRIPKGELSDKQTHALRIEARELLRQSSARDGILEPTGRESFGIS